MSLINQMLKDLEARRAQPDVNADILQGVSVPGSEPARSSRLLWALTAIMVSLFVAVIALVWLQLRAPQVPITSRPMRRHRHRKYLPRNQWFHSLRYPRA